MSAPEPPRHHLIDKLHARREHHQRRPRPVRVLYAVAGATLVLAGAAMLVLPGPAFVVLPLGLFLLALEFAWAEHLLEKTVDRLGEAGERVKRASPVGQAAVALLGVLAAAASLIVAYTWDIPLLPV